MTKRRRRKLRKVCGSRRGRGRGERELRGRGRGSARPVRLSLPPAAATRRGGRPSEDHAMNTNAAPVSLDSLPILGDEGRPRFLDDAFNDRPDDLGDWWLDLGRVDLPAGGR